jgi:aminoglycoside 6'-N-acetyltransferase
VSGGSAAPAGIVIRPATPDDEPAMVELEHASAIHHASVDPARWRVPPIDAIAAYRRNRRVADPDGGALVAEEDGQIVGMVELLPRGFTAEAGAARLPIPSVDIGLSVAPKWRGRGVGTALMRAAEEWAREHGASRIILDLAAANTGALHLYERLGYEVHGLLMDKVVARPAIRESGDAISRAAEIDAHAQINGDGGPVGEASGERTETARLDRHGDPIATIEGELVRLRPLVESDRAALIEVLRDPSVVEVWDTRGAEVSADELLADDEVTVFAIEVDGEFAGSIQYAEDDEPDYRHAGIDIFMSSQFQGRGLGTDAVRTLARYLLEVRGHHRLTIDPATSNARAIRTYEKVGFRPVGVMRRYERGVDQTFHDGLLMDLLAGELR